MQKLLLGLVCFFCIKNASFAQSKSVGDSILFYEMSLEQLMNVKVTVTSDLPMIGRESPGIVTVVTKEEILKSGARDLMQVLQMIPGFDFGIDVEGVVGVGVRGNWGHEGKVLMLWDGIEMNEELYSTLQFGGHYPLSQVKRIEIIRGPGSAMYGGNAEYAVINVITINGDLEGLNADVHYSTFNNKTASRAASVAYGKKWNETRISFSTFQSKGVRSDRDYIDNYGNAYSLSNLSSMNSSQYRIDFTHKKFNLIAFCDDYRLLQRDGYDEVYSQAYRSRFFNSSLLAKYDFNIGKLKITPGVKIKMEHPWYYDQTSVEDDFEPYDVTSSKNQAYLNYAIDPCSKINITGGFQYYNIIAKNRYESFTDGSSVFKSDNYGGHIQALAKTRFVNFTLGSRVVHNTYYGLSFVPRLGFTKIWEKFHVKSLYTIGYRAPSVENINLNWSIKPEYTYVKELEAGVKIGAHSYLTANIYDITTKDPIIYYYDSVNADMYKNVGKTGTRGFELDYKLKMDKRWFVAMNYSFYTTSGHRTVCDYNPKNDSYINLAFPAHKLNLIGSLSLGRSFSINPSITVYSERYAIIKSMNDAVIKYPAVIYGNINFSLDDFMTKGLTAQLSIFNITDENVWYIQPYNGNHAALPGASREIQIHLNYNLSGKNK